MAGRDLSGRTAVALRLAAAGAAVVVHFRSDEAGAEAVEADEVAAACLFLASPLAAAITGHDLVVDAGVSCHPTW